MSAANLCHFSLDGREALFPFQIKEIKGVAGGMGITGIKLTGITNGANTYHSRMQYINTKCTTMTLALGLQMEPILAQHEPKKVRGVAAD